MKLMVKLMMAALCFGAGIAVYAAADATAKDTALDNMKNRLKTVVENKRDGKVGENNLGYLAAMVKEDKTVDKLVADENADRKTVYDYIAATNKGITSKEVGQQRAKEIAKKAKPGEWLQDADGNWYQKPADDKKDKK
ncbi:MAG: YdbL family protein [Victivallaceae bacterium]|nr:YdbL family protein [Victivallaceae bacterium]